MAIFFCRTWMLFFALSSCRPVFIPMIPADFHTAGYTLLAFFTKLCDNIL